MSQTKLDVNYTITWVDPNIVITYAETYGAESYEGDDLICVAAPGTDHLVNIGSGDTLTTVDWRKDTTLGSASRSAFITAVLALVVEGAVTPDNHYIITTKDEFDTAITAATTAAVPYRFEIAAGTYAFAGTRVVFPDDGEIRGAGQSVTILTTTYVQGNNAAFEIGSNCTIRDLTLDYLDNGTTNAYLAANETPAANSYTRIARCRFTQFGGEALYIGSAGTDAVIEISDCLFDEPASGSADSGIYVNGTSTSASVRVSGCVFKDMDYGYYCDATGITETITSCLFDNNATNPFFTNSNTARSIKVTNNEFRDCAGDITFPTSTTNITDFIFGNNTFDNFTGTRPRQAGERLTDSYTSTTAIQFLGQTVRTVCDITVTPGEWLLSYKIPLSDNGATVGTSLIVDSAAAPSVNVSTSPNYTDVLIAGSQQLHAMALNHVPMSMSIEYTATASDRIHLVIFESTSPGATGNAVISNVAGTAILPSGSADNVPYLQALRLK